MSSPHPRFPSRLAGLLEPGFSRGRQLLVAVLVLVTAVCLCYANSLHGEFIYDDYGDLLMNPALRRLWPPTHYLMVWIAGKWHLIGRPLPTFTFALNHALGGTSTFGYHLFNMGIHVTATLALFGFLRGALKSAGHQLALPLAFAVALWWGIHPIQTESVAYITQRYEAMMGMFVLATFFFFQRSLEGGRVVLNQALSLAMLGCAFLCKEVAVGAPILLLLFDRAFHAGTFRGALSRRKGYYMGVLLLWAGFLWLQLQVGGREDWAGMGLKTPWWHYTLSQPAVILHYLRLALVPHPLILDHFLQGVPTLKAVLLPSLAILGLLGATVWLLVRRPRLGFAAASFWIILAPTSSFMPILDRCVEHRMYLPLAPVLVLVALGATWVVTRYRLMEKQTVRLLLVVGIGLGISALAIGTVLRNADYRTPVDIWQATADKAPHNGRALLNLGAALEEAGRPLEAEAAYRTSFKVMPAALPAHNLGLLLMRRGGEKEEVLHYLRVAVAIAPQEPLYEIDLARGYWYTGDTAKGQVVARAVLARPVLREESCRRLGVLLLQMQLPVDGEQAFRRALSYDQRSAKSHWLLGMSLLMQDRREEGWKSLEHATDLDGRSPNALVRLAWTHYQHGDEGDAAKLLNAALAQQPTHARGLARLAWLRSTSQRAELRNAPEALELVKRLEARVQGVSAEFLEIKAAALAAAGRMPEAVQVQSQVLGLPGLGEAVRAEAAERLEQYRQGRAYVVEKRSKWLDFDDAPML